MAIQQQNKRQRTSLKKNSGALHATHVRLCASVLKDRAVLPHIWITKTPSAHVPLVRYKTAEMWMLHWKRAAHGWCIFKSLIDNKFRAVRGTCLCHTLAETPINASTDVWEGDPNLTGPDCTAQALKEGGVKIDHHYLWTAAGLWTVQYFACIWRVALKPFDWLQSRVRKNRGR